MDLDDGSSDGEADTNIKRSETMRLTLHTMWIAVMVMGDIDKYQTSTEATPTTTANTLHQVRAT